MLFSGCFRFRAGWWNYCCLKHLPAWNEARRNKAKIYLDLLKEVDGVILPKTNKHCLHVYHLFVIQVDNRDDVVEALKQMGISTGLHYPILLHMQKAYEHLGLAAGSFPVAEACAKRLLSLPMFPELTEEQIRWVSSSLKKIVNL